MLPAHTLLSAGGLSAGSATGGATRLGDGAGGVTTNPTTGNDRPATGEPLREL